MASTERLSESRANPALQSPFPSRASTHGQVCRATWIPSFVMVLSPLISKHALDLREQAVEQPEVFFR
jgi:hypothetical protein